MDRLKKINEVKTLNKLIQEKQLLINKENQELLILEEELKKIKQSELPILLFVIDETLPMPDDERDICYEYIYYFPDLDEVEYLIGHNYNQPLQNSLDLRSYFEKMGIPKRIWPGSVRSTVENRTKIELAISYLKNMIDDLFKTYDIKSWSELTTYLCETILEKEKIKKIKLNKL